MTLHRLDLPRHDHPFIGTWHIYTMEMWDADYFNMEIQAFIEVRPDNLGTFQFGLVSGGLHGYVEGEPPRQRFAFTWEGNDEMDPVSGSGWLRLRGDAEVLGMINIHQHDRSRFKARRVVQAGTPGQKV
jgi:hypothetical protein